MKTLEKIEKLIENLKSVKGLTFKTLNVVKQDLSISETELPTEFNEISRFSNLEFFWFLKLENAKIIALDLEGDMTVGLVKINIEQILLSLNDGFSQDPLGIYKNALQTAGVNDNFLVIDNLYPSHLIGYVINNNVIEDKLFFMTASDSNLHKMSIGISEYMDYGYSCGFFNGWQALFIDSTIHDEDTKKLGYYVPQILPKDIHEPFMQKFRERFGEIEYKPEDYR